MEAEVIFDVVRDATRLSMLAGQTNVTCMAAFCISILRMEKFGFSMMGTEGGIANVLVKRGVPKEDIVLAFHSPFKRQFTEFAVG